jgi:phosphonate metabolism protein (transferase hexapeptide repeat family)
MVIRLKKIIRHWLLSRRFPESTINFGAVADKQSSLGRYSVLFSNVVLQNTTIDDYSYVQKDTIISATKIGKFCSIASNVNIGLAEHPMHMVSTSPIFYDNSQPLPRFIITSRTFTADILRTIIGADVWIGHGAVIKAGVKIGVGSIIGAGAIVTKDIPPYTIAAGNPCKLIRKRFSDDISSRLIASEWWDLNDSKLKELAPLFTSPAKLLEMLEN